MSKMSEMDVMVKSAIDLYIDGYTQDAACETIAKGNSLNEAECDYLLEAVEGAINATDFNHFDPEDEASDYLLERQEMEDFAQDGDFENMDASEIY